MNIQFKMSPEQFEALDEYIKAVADERVAYAFNRDSYSGEERRAAYESLVEREE